MNKTLSSPGGEDNREKVNRNYYPQELATATSIYMAATSSKTEI
ncbi:MAG TPA: hypothetical protein V6D25_05920 [Leptolyngbyaceae cyanobacterium]